MSSHKQQFTQILTAFALTLSLSFAATRAALASEITPEKVVELINQDRSADSVPALTVNDNLTRAAEAKADDMAREEYFAHTSPKGLTPWYWIEKNGYMYRYAGENLAIRFTDAEEQNQAWMDSPKHRENILNNKYQETGVAVRTITLQDGTPSLLTVEMFGTRAGQVLAAASSSVVSPTPSNKSVAADKPEMTVTQNASVASNTSSLWILLIQTVGLLMVGGLIVWGSVNISKCGQVLALEIARRKHA